MNSQIAATSIPSQVRSITASNGKYAADSVLFFGRSHNLHIKFVRVLYSGRFSEKQWVWKGVHSASEYN
jgi:hypothetical protein